MAEPKDSSGRALSIGGSYLCGSLMPVTIKAINHDHHLSLRYVTLTDGRMIRSSQCHELLHPVATPAALAATPPANAELLACLTDCAGFLANCSPNDSPVSPTTVAGKLHKRITAAIANAGGVGDGT